MLLKDVRYFRQRKIGIELNLRKVCERARVKNIQGLNMCRSSLRLYSSSCVGHFVQEMPELSQWSLLLERPSDLPVPVNPGKDPTVWYITHCTPQHYHYGVETRQFIHAEHLYCLPCYISFNETFSSEQLDRFIQDFLLQPSFMLLTRPGVFLLT